MKQYDLILQDPPWHYSNRKTGGERCNKTKFGGGAMKHYPLIKDKELLALGEQIRDLSAPNSVTYMWATGPRLVDGFALQYLKACGLAGKTTGFTWVKVKADGSPIYGPGYYTASNPEFCLIGTRGKGIQPVRKMTPSVILEPRGKHSQKPDIYGMLEAMYPEARKLELFARNVRPGWDSMGNFLTGLSLQDEIEQLRSAANG